MAERWIPRFFHVNGNGRLGIDRSQIALCGARGPGAGITLVGRLGIMTQSVSVDVGSLNQRTSLSFLIPGRIFHYGRQSEQISIIVHKRESSLNRPGVDGSRIATGDVASPLGNPGRGLSIAPGGARNLSLRIWRGSPTQAEPPRK